MPKSIFISKNLQDTEALQLFCEENGLSLTAESLLRFNPREFRVEQEFDVVFFSSPRSLTFFLSKHSLSPTDSIACTGVKTKNVAESFGLKVDFFGTSSNPVEVAQQFKEWLGSRRVLFPLSNISKKTISSVISENHKEEVVVYETEFIDKKIGAHDMYVFSSPSNAEAFLISGNEIGNAEVVSWGTSTKKALDKKGVRSHVMNEPTLECLIETIKELFDN
jgi:uroporphyrinogen-III synthase